MCRAREAIATTSFEGVREREKGFDGRGIVEGVGVVVAEGEMWCMCRVESHEAEIRRLSGEL